MIEGFMLSNDILCSVCYILKVNNIDLVCILVLGNVDVMLEQIVIWLCKEEEEGFQCCLDIVLFLFFNGFIYEKCGKDEVVFVLMVECCINNNIVLKKLCIVFLLKIDDILVIFIGQLFCVLMLEIIVMMCVLDYKNFCECGDQFMCYFLCGLVVCEYVVK